MGSAETVRRALGIKHQGTGGRRLEEELVLHPEDPGEEFQPVWQLPWKQKLMCCGWHSSGGGPSGGTPLLSVPPCALPDPVSPLSREGPKAPRTLGTQGSEEANPCACALWHSKPPSECAKGHALPLTWSLPIATRQYLLPCPTSASSSGMVIPEKRKVNVINNEPKTGGRGAQAPKILCNPKFRSVWTAQGLGREPMH